MPGKLLIECDRSDLVETNVFVNSLRAAACWQFCSVRYFNAKAFRRFSWYVLNKCHHSKLICWWSCDCDWGQYTLQRYAIRCHLLSAGVVADHVEDPKGGFMSNSISGWKLVLIIVVAVIGIAVCVMVAIVVIGNRNERQRKRFYSDSTRMRSCVHRAVRVMANLFRRFKVLLLLLCF